MARLLYKRSYTCKHATEHLCPYVQTYKGRRKEIRISSACLKKGHFFLKSPLFSPENQGVDAIVGGINKHIRFDHVDISRCRDHPIVFTFHFSNDSSLSNDALQPTGVVSHSKKNIALHRECMIRATWEWFHDPHDRS